jgi:hypothetical protein
MQSVFEADWVLTKGPKDETDDDGEKVTAEEVSAG